jgi:hypothetical protein
MSGHKEIVRFILIRSKALTTVSSFVSLHLLAIAGLLAVLLCFAELGAQPGLNFASSG